MDVKELPAFFVRERWTKDAAKKYGIEFAGNVIQQQSRSTRTTVKLNELWLEFQMLVGLVGNNDDGIDELLLFLKKMRVEKEKSGKMAEISRTDIIESLVGVSQTSEVNIQNPEVCRNKGTGKRLMSGKELAMAQAEKRKRKCKLCGKTNHDKRTCQLRNSGEVTK